MTAATYYQQIHWKINIFWPEVEMVTVVAGAMATVAQTPVVAVVAVVTEMVAVTAVEVMATVAGTPVETATVAGTETEKTTVAVNKSKTSINTSISTAPDRKNNNSIRKKSNTDTFTATKMMTVRPCNK
jgi:hypothetical protein